MWAVSDGESWTRSRGVSDPKQPGGNREIPRRRGRSRPGSTRPLVFRRGCGRHKTAAPRGRRDHLLRDFQHQREQSLAGLTSVLCERASTTRLSRDTTDLGIGTIPSRPIVRSVVRLWPPTSSGGNQVSEMQIWVR